MCYSRNPIFARLLITPRCINCFCLRTIYQSHLLLILSETLADRLPTGINSVESGSEAIVEVGVLRFVQLLWVRKSTVLFALFQGGSGDSDDVECWRRRRGRVGDSKCTGRYSFRLDWGDCWGVQTAGSGGGVGAVDLISLKFDVEDEGVWFLGDQMPECKFWKFVKFLNERKDKLQQQ